MIPFLVRKVFFPIHELIKRHPTMKLLSELEQVQWYSLERIRQLQFMRLKALIEHAYTHVPYYREVFERIGLLPGDFRSWKDLDSIPLLTKDLIRANLDRLKARNTVGQLIKTSTGGSTGVPLTFYSDRMRISSDIASLIRSRRWWSIDLGEKEVVLWGSPIEVTRQDQLRQLRDKLLNTKLLSAFDMTREKMHEYVVFIRRYRPAHLFGYPSSIALLCQFVEGEGIDLSHIGVRVVFVTAEVLYPHQKDIIEQTFNCPVANGYGGRDGGFIAHDCPAGSMHTSAENIYLEFLDRQRAARDNPSEIIVTHLRSYGMPFIRYQIGDLGIPGENSCSCGRGLPTIKIIEGRSTDFIITPSGKIMHALSVIYILREVAGIDQFKVIQKERDSLLIKIVPNSKYESADSQWIRTQIEARMQSKVTVTFEFVEKIEPDRSGKFRYVVSEVPAQSLDAP